MLITISRQFAAGGSQVARRVAETLGWRLIDNEFVDQVAERAGMPVEEVAARQERPPSLLERLARFTALDLPDLFVPAAGVTSELSEESLVQITRGLVEELAAEGRCVLVGRASAAVLARRSHTLHVRLVAPREFRSQVAMEALQIEKGEALRRIDKIDANRGRYHREYYGRDSTDALHYDMVLNTGRLGFAGTAEIIVARARALGWS